MRRINTRICTYLLIALAHRGGSPKEIHYQAGMLPVRPRCLAAVSSDWRLVAAAARGQRACETYSSTVVWDTRSERPLRVDLPEGDRVVALSAAPAGSVFVLATQGGAGPGPDAHRAYTDSASALRRFKRLCAGSAAERATRKPIRPRLPSKAMLAMMALARRPHLVVEAPVTFTGGRAAPAFSPDGTQMAIGVRAVGSGSGALALCDLRRGRVSRVVRMDFSWDPELSYSPYSKHLVAISHVGSHVDGASQEYAVTVLDAGTGRRLRDLSRGVGVAIGPLLWRGPRTVGALIALGQTGRPRQADVVFWNIESGQEVFRRPSGGYQRFAISGDGSTLAGASSVPVIRVPMSAAISDVNSDVGLSAVRGGAKVAGWRLAHSWVNGMAFTPDGRRLIAVGQALKSGVVGRTLVNVLDAHTAAVLATCSVPKHTAYQFAISPDGRVIALPGQTPSTPFGGALILFDVKTYRSTRRLGIDWIRLSNAAFSPSGRIVAAGGEWPCRVAHANRASPGGFLGAAALWSARTGELLACLALVPTSHGDRHDWTWVAFLPDGRWDGPAEVTPLLRWATGAKLSSGKVLLTRNRCPGLLRQALRACFAPPNGRRS